MLEQLGREGIYQLSHWARILLMAMDNNLLFLALWHLHHLQIYLTIFLIYWL